MSAETNFMQHVCEKCGGSERLVMNGFDVMSALADKEKKIDDLEREIAELQKFRNLCLAKSKLKL